MMGHTGGILHATDLSQLKRRGTATTLYRSANCHHQGEPRDHVPDDGGVDAPACTMSASIEGRAQSMQDPKASGRCEELRCRWICMPQQRTCMLSAAEADLTLTCCFSDTFSRFQIGEARDMSNSGSVSMLPRQRS